MTRDQWKSHPNYPSQSLLLGSHDNFLRLNRELVAASTGPRPAELESLYRRWISAMRSHEHYEEYKLYPYLEKRWNTSLSDAQKGHELLHRAHVEVLSAFQTLHDDEEGPARLTAALSFHEQILKEHLALEEERVIPLLLSLSPEEFRNYYNSSIHTLLSQLSESE